MASASDLPDDIDALKAALLAANDRAAQVEAELAVAKARASNDQALIAHQQLQIAKLTRELYGQHSERSVRLLDQMELAFEELESSATEDELVAERATAKTANVVASPASGRHASLFLSICRASGWSSPDLRPASVAAARGCASWARTSPRRWR
jgi:hypothetical protein